MPTHLKIKSAPKLLAQVAACRRSLAALSDDLLRCETILTQLEDEVAATNRPDPPARVSSKPVTPNDRLIDFREVMQLLGLRCRTGHTARALATRGQIRMVRLNERTIRFSEASVHELIANRTAIV